MNPIFGRGPSLQLRLFLAIFLSASLALADSRLDAFANVRYWLNSSVTPIQYLANVPRTLLDDFYQRFSSKQSLITTNRILRDQLLQSQNDALLLKQYKEENNRLRKLLGSTFVRDERKMVTEVMAVDSSIYRHEVVIDKGHTDGVYVGQPVSNEQGIVGQVVNVSAYNSRVLLSTDPNVAIPVQVVRNDIRVIASGTGNIHSLQLQHIPSNSDIIEGDLLVTSSLGGVYPEGYPVGYVSTVIENSYQEFATIIATPSVDFTRLRFLLLIWPTEERTNLLSPAEESPVEAQGTNAEQQVDSSLQRGDSEQKENTEQETNNEE